jgi:hypothetical protein
MAARRKGQGQLDNAQNVTALPTYKEGIGQARKASGGRYKEGVDLHTGKGLRVCLKRCAGTARNVLKQPYFFQVPPLESITTNHGYNFTDYETINEGQFSRGMSRQLKTVEFQTMFVDQDWFYVLVRHRNAGPDPQKLSEQLSHILNSGTPFKLLIGNLNLWDNYDVQMKATLRTLTVEERAGEIDARYVNVSFTEHRDLEIQEDEEGEELPQTYKPQPGDTLRTIAKEFYGEGNAWKLIVLANPALKEYRPDMDLAVPTSLYSVVRSLYLPAKFAVGNAEVVPGGGKKKG